MSDVTYTIEAAQDDVPVRGAVAKECEDEILERLRRDDVWAWAQVTVMAHASGGGFVFTGKAYLGCCSYENEAAFKQDDYYADLCLAALDDLRGALSRAEALGMVAKELSEGLL